jgi:hypothetical protein
MSNIKLNPVKPASLSLLPLTMPPSTSATSTPVLEPVNMVFRANAAREQLNDHPDGAKGGEGEDG